jgi:hypothetical protein
VKVRGWVGAEEAKPEIVACMEYKALPGADVLMYERLQPRTPDVFAPEACPGLRSGALLQGVMKIRIFCNTTPHGLHVTIRQLEPRISLRMECAAIELVGVFYRSGCRRTGLRCSVLI